MTHHMETVFAESGGMFGIYEPPEVQYHGPLNDVLRRLFPNLCDARPRMDQRITKLLHFIDSHEGSIGWDLDRACRELKLDISGAHAARLFKRCTGLGVREYAKRRRLLLAAERLKSTDIPVKTIAAEFGYQSLPHFTRRFKSQFRLSPTEFRKRATASKRSRKVASVRRDSSIGSISLDWSIAPS
jgi:AraC-like DNA-binding protein